MRTLLLYLMIVSYGAQGAGFDDAEACAPDDLTIDEQTEQVPLPAIDFATLETFLLHLKNSRIEPGWVIQELLDMHAQEFGCAVLLLVDCLVERPWEYVGVAQKDFVRAQQVDLLKRHCIEYLRFFESVFINTKDNSVSVFEVMPSGNQLVFLPLKMMAPQLQCDDAIARLHAFFFDCIAMEFLEKISDSYLHRDDQAVVSSDFDEIVRSYELFYPMIEELRGTAYELQYVEYFSLYSSLFSAYVGEVLRGKE